MGMVDVSDKTKVLPPWTSGQGQLRLLKQPHWNRSMHTALAECMGGKYNLLHLARCHTEVN